MKVVDVSLQTCATSAEVDAAAPALVEMAEMLPQGPNLLSCNTNALGSVILGCFVYAHCLIGRKAAASLNASVCCTPHETFDALF